MHIAAEGGLMSLATLESISNESRASPFSPTTEEGGLELMRRYQSL